MAAFPRFAVQSHVVYGVVGDPKLIKGRFNVLAELALAVLTPKGVTLNVSTLKRASSFSITTYRALKSRGYLPRNADTIARKITFHR